MELEKKSEIYIFLDTNVFEQCKSFTEINWSIIVAKFKPDIEYGKFILKVPYMVIMELDDHKKTDNKARKALAIIRKFEKSFTEKKDLKLQISIIPPRWDDLDSNIKDYLIENEKDHRILAEILLFKKQNLNIDILFITGDYVPHKLAAELGINTLNWLDEEYKSCFQAEKIKKKPDLELLFMSERNRSSLIEWEYKTPHYLAFEDIEELYEEIKREDPMRFEELKPVYELESDIEIYNQQIEDFSHYIEVKFMLINNGNHPYSNIDIFINTQLEKEFKIKYKTDVKIPTKPELFDDLWEEVSSQYAIDESEVMYYVISRNEIDHQCDFGYHIEKVKHNEDFLIPFPIMIWIPEKPKHKKITFKIQFTYDEPGKIKEQKLEINLN